MRVAGAGLVLLACCVLAVDGMSWDTVLFALPAGVSHGVHLSEVVAFALAAVGVAALWRGGNRA
jgi:hypothetical protein